MPQPQLPPQLPVLVVDVANVMGSRADGWWRDRAAAASRLVDEVRAAGVASEHEVLLVLEGAARAGEPAGDGGEVRIVHADGSGDDAVVALVRAMADQDREVTVVTADRELRDRVTAAGAEVRGPRWLLEQLP